jgi:hypothetical protein
MSLKTVLIFNTICAGVWAFTSLFIPETLLSLYGVEYNDTLVFMVRIFGVMALAICLVSFSLRNSEYNSEVKSVILALLLSTIFGVIIAIWTIASIETRDFGWIVIINYVILFLVHLSVILRYKFININNR